MSDVWKIVASLASPLAGDPPQLDALLEACMKHDTPGTEERLVSKSDPCPPVGSVRIPLAFAEWCGHRVYRASSPIFRASGDRHEHYCQRMDVGLAHLQAPDKRRVLNATGGEFKAYRLPIRVRDVPMVAWFAVGDGREIRRVLARRVHCIGKKTSQGFGRVSDWWCERHLGDDVTWFAPTEQGDVLMRPLPAGNWLARRTLLGFRRSYGACQGPYWHPDRFMEVVEPC